MDEQALGFDDCNWDDIPCCPHCGGMTAQVTAMDERFQEIAALAPDWDGEGAEKPSEVAIANARRFLQEIATLGAPTVGPCADGTIDLWWSASGRKYLLINFTEDGSAGFCAEIGGMKFKGSAHSASTNEVPK